MRLVGYRIYHPEVLRFHQSSARIKIVSSPARTSKSYAAAHDLLEDFFPPIDLATGRPLRAEWRGWIVCPDYKTSKEWDYLYDALVLNRVRAGFDYNVTTDQNSPSHGAMKIVVTWGTTPEGLVSRSILEGKSATHERSLQGEEVDVVILSEAAELEERIWTQYLASRYGRAIFPTTPKIRAAWLHRMIEMGESYPELDVAHFRFTPHANPRYDWERFWDEHMRAESRVFGAILTLPKDKHQSVGGVNGHDCFDEAEHCPAAKDPSFAEQFLGHWTYEQGRALPFRWMPSVDGHCHVLDTLPDWVPYARKTLATDYGYQDPAVAGFWAVDADGTKVLCHEIYERKLTASDFVAKIREKERSLGWRIERYVGDPQNPQVEAHMRKLGLPVFNMNKMAQRDRKSGHMRLCDELSVDPRLGRPRLFVHRACKQTIEEWKQLRFKGDHDGRFASGCFVGREDAWDMARYFLATEPKGRPVRATDQEWEEHRAFVLRMRSRQAMDHPLVGRSGLGVSGSTPRHA